MKYLARQLNDKLDLNAVIKPRIEITQNTSLKLSSLVLSNNVKLKSILVLTESFGLFTLLYSVECLH